MKKPLIICALLLFSSVALTLGEGLFAIPNYYTYPTDLQPNTNNVILNVDLFHGGTRTYKNITVEAKFQDPFTGVNVISSIPKMDPKDTFTLTYEFNVGSAAAGVYAVPIHISYIDTGASTDLPRTEIKQISIPIGVSKDLDISNLNTIIEPGKFQTLSFTVENTGDLLLSDLMVSLSTSLSVSIADNSLRISELAPDASKKVSFNLFADRGTAPGVYPLTIKIESNQVSKQEDVGLIVKGIPNIVLAGISTDLDEPKGGQRISLSVQLENLGTGDARSVKASLSNDIIGIKDSYIGTIEVDDTDSAVFDLTFHEPGTNELPLTVTYMDNDGTEYMYSTSLEVFIYTTPTDYSGLFILAIIVALAFLYMRRKKLREKQLKKVK